MQQLCKHDVHYHSIKCRASNCIVGDDTVATMTSASLVSQFVVIILSENLYSAPLKANQKRSQPSNN